MFERLEYINAECTMIAAHRGDKSVVLIEPITADLWAMAIGGELGKINPFVPPSAQDLLADERAGMVCSRLQARIAIGPDTCAALDAMAADLQTPWALRQTLLYAQEWQRNHQSMDELGWALGYDPAQIDDMFRLAMTL